MGCEMINPTFVDDVTIAVAGKNKVEAMENAESLIKESEEWGRENGIQFEEKKMEWIELSKEEEGITWSLEVGEGWKEEGRCVKWLGVWIDKELKFKEHLERKMEKGRKVAGVVKGLSGGGKRGMGVGNARKMYVACAKATMEYGSRAWWRGQKGMARKMDKENERAMRKIGGHLRTAPGGAIMVENDMGTSESRMNNRQKRNVIQSARKNKDNRMRVMVEEAINRSGEPPEWGERKGKKIRETTIERGVEMVGEGIKGEWEEREEPKRRDTKEAWWETELRGEMEISIEEWNEKEEERQRMRCEGDDEVIIYSDGSKRKDGVGVGVCRMWQEGDRGGVVWGKSYKMGKRMEIMDAEMVVIRKALEWGIKECVKEKRKRVTVRVDSQEAMRRCKERRREGGEMMAEKIRKLWREAKWKKIEVKLEWVKGHAKIWGNEEADRLSRRGAESGGAVDREAFISEAWMLREAKEQAEEEWSKEWEKEKSRQGKEYGLDPKTRYKAAHHPAMRREKVILSRLRTGHVNINKYMKRIGKRDNDECECGEGEQSVEHVLLRCRMAGETREVAEGSMKEEMTMMALLYTGEGMEWAVKIWDKFVSERRGVLRDQEEQNGTEERAEKIWGMGDLN